MGERKRGKQWVRVGHGVHRPAAAKQPFGAELRAWLPQLPATGVYTGITAARIHGLWLPPLPAALPLFVAMGGRRGEVKPLRQELVVSRHDRVPARMTRDGIPVAPVPEALLACARWMGLLDVVVLVDSVLRLGLASAAEVLAAAAPRRKGAPRLRLAVALSDPRAESPWEVVLRMFHRAVGVPVTPQVELRDEAGFFVARADLLLDGTRTLHEYDGAGHRTAATHRSDLRRDRELVAAAYRRRGYTSQDLIRHPLILLQDCDEALGRGHDPSRLDAWDEKLQESCFTTAGQRRLIRRIGRSQLVLNASSRGR